MKTSVSLTLIPSLILVMAASPDAVAQPATTQPPSSARSERVPLTPKLLATGPVLSVTINQPDIPSQVVAAGPGIPAPPQRALPPNLHLSPWTTEIVKLAEAGTDDSVMLSFIDNSGTFSLGADQIIYLNDLGVPGRVITAMLQHDNEVLSGLRPLTIASQPPLDSNLISMFNTSKDDSPQARAQSAAVPAPSDSVTRDLPIAAKDKPAPEVQQNVPAAQPVELQYAMTHETGPITSVWSSQLPENHGSLYPVREPYPVELLPPIIFLGAAERTPNTLVILGFPHDTH